MLQFDGMLKDSPERVAQLRTLIGLSATINSSLDISEVRKRTIEAAVELVHAETGSLLFVDEETGDLYFDVALGGPGECVKTIRLAKGQGIAGWVAEHGEPTIVHDVQNDPRFFRDADRKSEFHTLNMVCLPVNLKEKRVGVLEAINKRSGSFGAEDVEILAALSNQVAVAIENARLYDELRETFYTTVYALAETIEKRDPYTGGHTRRVMNYSLAIGKAMSLSQKEMIGLRLSAILHDIGKIGIPDAILLKNERLTFEEYRVIIMHPAYGAEILNHIKQLKEIVPGVKWHHEKYDGSGYPEGLKGEEIPVIARIIAVADTFDAMTTDRPYRKGLSARAAFEELEKNAGTQFDPSVVGAFIGSYREGGSAFGER
ncbi:MAG: GAF domain-containing protein [Nitrospirae bacterium]|nr:GAF domain-containing protein [Nitrospirota bacterium]